MPDVKGQLAMATGASSGLGEATAVQLAELGARVALLARSRAGLDRVAARISAAGGGTIVNVSSVAGRRGWASASAYCATKFGLAGLTQALAAEGAPHAIRVVCLYPGAMATHWGTWTPTDRDQPQRAAPRDQPQ